MKIFICLSIFLFQISAWAQTFNPALPTTAAPSSASGAAPASGASNAEGAAGNSMTTGLIEGAVSAGMGVYLMVQGHASIAKGNIDIASGNTPLPGTNPALIAAGTAEVATGNMEMITGGSLVAAGAADAIQAQGYGNTGNQIASDPTLPTSPGVTDPYIQGLQNTANQIAAQAGTTVPALASQANSAGASGDGGGGGGGSLGSFASNLPQSVKDGMAKAAADASVHYRVVSVATEGGGGGAKGETPFDLNGILNGLKGDRGPASIAGLQKSLNGEPIGVAQDNIFKQVTRKYQDKIALRMFLPIQK